MSKELAPQNSIDTILRDEYEFGVGYGLRWLVYEHADDGVDFHQSCVDVLGLSGHEDVLDIGCGNGGFLGVIAEKGHKGKLVGTDFTSSLQYALTKEGQINYFRANASVDPENNSASKALPIKDGAFDVSTALFMLYHVESPEQTLREMSRIVRTGGKIAVATSGPSNKQEHRKIEAKVAASLGIEPPLRYAQKFTTDTAELILPRIFSAEPKVFRQQTTVTITSDDVYACVHEGTYNVYATYLDSLKSMNRHYGSAENRTKNLYREIGAVTLEHVMDRIETDGCFQETIDRAFYIVENLPL